MSASTATRQAILVAAALAAMASQSSRASDSGPDYRASTIAGLEWRLVGPHRAGWGTMAVGDPARPDYYVMGTAGGGVWSTNDSGRTWQSLTDKVRLTSVGAIALAPTKPDRIYVGSGQPEPRYDIAAGNGMYRSDDGGATWQAIGLEATRHIGAIYVDPRNPDIVVVGALGHVFGPNPERGVYRSTDAGKTWTQTLAINADTGIVDIAADPEAPSVLIASAWQARVYPWMSYFKPITGPGSALYISNDDGIHWQKLGGEGWPKGDLGRIAVATSRVNGRLRIYAQVDSETAGGLYRSDDAGAHWLYVNSDKGLGGWYTARITVEPDNPDALWVMGQSQKRSLDGGKTLTIVRGSPGGDDYHHLWINSREPRRRIASSDQGTAVSVNGGATWSSWYNQPTGQVYHIATDDRVPYWIYAGQQDNGSIGIASRSDYGQITFREWHPVGADERDDDIPDPEDPNIVYGSGLGGRLSRWNATTGEVANITPWPVGTYGKRGNTVKYRYTWITPIAVSKKPPFSLYQGAQVLFRSNDKGASWQVISPDLSGKSREGKSCEADLDRKAAKECGFGVIYAIAPSPRSPDEIWVGTDDGVVQMTRDGGAHWSNVTPKGLPDWGKVASVDLSAQEEGVAYIAVDRQRADDFSPRIYKTHDYGASWTEITEGLPKNEFVDVVRVDPVQPGLLYAGGQYGVYVSLDDGAHWQPLQNNLPTAWVRDLRVHGDDLIAGTQGRAIWVLTDVAPLRELAAISGAASMELFHPAVKLFQPADAWRFRRNNNRDTPLPPEEPAGRNPPTGAIIDYYLAQDLPTELTLEIRDSKGAVVRRFTSNDAVEKLPGEVYFNERYLHPAAPLSNKAGFHRFVWNLRSARPRAAGYNYSIAAVDGEDTPLLPEGLMQPPGGYSVLLSTGAGTWKDLKAFSLRDDPRVRFELPAYEQLRALYDQAVVVLAQAAVAVGQQKGVLEQLELRAKLPAVASNAALLKSVTATRDAIAALAKGQGEAHPSVGTIDETVAGFVTDLESSDQAPNAPLVEAVGLYGKHLETALAAWQQVQAKQLATLNAALVKAGQAAVVVPDGKDLVFREDEGKDLP